MVVIRTVCQSVVFCQIHSVPILISCGQFFFYTSASASVTRTKSVLIKISSKIIFNLQIHFAMHLLLTLVILR